MKKIKYILLGLALLGTVTMVFADKKGDEVPKTISLSGKVIDKISQEALAGALVKIEGADIEVYTDLDGNFTITGMVPDTYKIKCSMISYDDLEEEVEIYQKVEKMEIQLLNFSGK